MRDERLYCDDILRAADFISSFLSGVSEDEWIENEQLQSAVTYQLIVIGEAAARVSAELRSRYPEVPWVDIVGFRNLAVHAYFAVNPNIVWTTARVDVPALAVSIERIIANDFPQ